MLVGITSFQRSGAKDSQMGKNKKVDYLRVVGENDDEQQAFKIEDTLKIQVLVAIVLSVIFIITLGIYFVLANYTVTNVYVEGNEHYTASEIRNIVQQGRFGDNTIYLSLKYSGKSITDVPFIEKMDVNVVDKNTIKISVYEKVLAGYVEYIGKYIYFDKDGIVVESSDVKTKGIPLVSGLAFDHFVMYEQLPVENKDVFKTILDVTLLLGKYEIETDRIYFDGNDEITLYFDNVRVGLGTTNLLEEKIQKLDAILPDIKGKSGYLNMGSYDEGNDSFTFTFDH